MSTDDGDRPGSWSGSALVARGAGVVQEVSAGSTGGTDPGPCTASTRFQAGSISKQVMAVVVLALQEREALPLDRPVGHWLTDLPSHLRPLTLTQLLSHTSGTGHWGDLPGLGPLLSDPPDPDALLAALAGTPLLSAPGERWRYSGPGFLLAGRAVEVATTSGYGDLAAELVLTPAGMTTTTSGRFPLGEPGVAIGHHGGRPIDVAAGFARLPGTGDLWTTTGDLLRYGRALRHGGLLEPATAARLWTVHAELDPPDPPGRPTAGTGYGLGTFLGRVRGHRAWYVPGDNPGYQSLLAHLPDLDVDLAVLGNEESPGVDAALQQLELPA